MSVGRNDPCPCGSGKKYKKCCLGKDEAAARAQASDNARAAEEKRQADEAARQAQQEQADREREERRKAEPPVSDTLAAESQDSNDSREPNWPPLAEADQRLVDAWWEEVSPVYLGKEGRKECGWLLERTLAFLDQQPRLFRYLYLHEEFLFELAGALARAGRMEDYLALLRRLRAEQPEMYFQCFGYYDGDLLAEALRTDQREDIPACLELFRQHPVKHIDQFADVVDLLAWRGCASELRELLGPTALTVAESPEVLGGDFGLLWLTNLAIFPFVEAGDDSPQAVDQLCQAAFAVGLLASTDPKNREWLRRAVRLGSRSLAEAELDLKSAKGDWFHHDVGWSFTGWVRRTKGLPWTSARFLANSLLEYWGWKEQEKKSVSPFGLNETRLDHYLAQRCQDFIGLKGVRAASTLQAFHYFTDYLVAHNYFSVPDADRLQSAAARFYEIIRRSVDVCDPAFRICPTYAALIAGPEKPSAQHRSAAATPPTAD